MDHRRALKSIEHGIGLWWRAIGSTRGQSLHGAGYYHWVLSDNRMGAERIFNVKLPIDGTADAIDALIDGMRSGKLPGGMILTPESTPADIAVQLAAKGLAIHESYPCMALELAAFMPSPAPDVCRVRRVEAEAMLRSWVRVINGSLFGPDLFCYGQYEDFFGMDNISFFIAEIDGQPASACMVIHEGADATLECVGTLPEYRRMGLGQAVVSLALEELKPLDVEMVTLRSEPDGINLYHKLGFIDICPRTVSSLR